MVWTRPPVALLVPIALIAGTAFLAYHNALRAELVYDDVTDIVQNKYVRTSSLWRIFTEPSWATWVGVGYSGYRPLTTLTFALNHWVQELRPFGYHAVNVALHAAVSVLLAIGVTRITGRWRAACLAGLLFAAHPVHADAVASVVGRAEVLAALFALAAWLMLLRSRSAATHRTTSLGLAGLLVAAGALAKESAVTIIPTIIAVDALSWRRATGEAATSAPRVWQYASLVAGGIAALALRTMVTGGVGNNVIVEMDNPLVGATVSVRLWTTLKVIALYARTLVWPVHLSADYSYRQVELAGSPIAADVMTGLAIVMALALIARWAWSRAPDVYVGVAVLCATSSLALAATFLSLGPIMGERLMYLPSAGFCLLAASALDRLWGWRGKPGRIVAGVVLGILLAGYVTRTVARNRVWRDRLTFAEALVADAPMSARSHRELGLIYSELGRHDEAIAELVASRGIVMHPATSYNLGNVLLAARRLEDASRAYQEALAQKPDFVEAMTNLANVYSDQGDEEKAEPWLRRALEIDPDAVDARLNLANAMVRRGGLAEAAPQYERVIQRDPRDPLVRTNYGLCLEALRRPSEAVQQYRVAISLDPRSPLPHARLVVALSAAGRADEARAAQASAERFFPDDPGVRQNRRLFDGPR